MASRISHGKHSTFKSRSGRASPEFENESPVPLTYHGNGINAFDTEFDVICNEVILPDPDIALASYHEVQSNKPFSTSEMSRLSKATTVLRGGDSNPCPPRAPIRVSEGALMNKLPLIVRQRIYTHLLKDEERKVTLSPKSYLKEAFQEGYFATLDEVLLPVEGAMGTCRQMRAEMNIMFWAKYQFHLTLNNFTSPYNRMPSALSFLAQNMNLVQSLTIEIDFTRYAFSKSAEAWRLVPVLDPFEKAIRFLAEKILLRDTSIPYVHLICRRYHGYRDTADTEGKTIRFCADENLRVISSLAGLKDKIESLRMSGFSRTYTTEMFKWLFKHMDTQKQFVPADPAWPPTPEVELKLIPGSVRPDNPPPGAPEPLMDTVSVASISPKTSLELLDFAPPDWLREKMEAQQQEARARLTGKSKEAVFGNPEEALPADPEEAISTKSEEALSANPEEAISAKSEEDLSDNSEDDSPIKPLRNVCFVAKAIKRYAKASPDSLALKFRDIVIVWGVLSSSYGTTEEMWWGRVGERKGTFPKSCVREEPVLFYGTALYAYQCTRQISNTLKKDGLEFIEGDRLAIDFLHNKDLAGGLNLRTGMWGVFQRDYVYFGKAGGSVENVAGPNAVLCFVVFVPENKQAQRMFKHGDEISVLQYFSETLWFGQNNRNKLFGSFNRSDVEMISKTPEQLKAIMEANFHHAVQRSIPEMTGVPLPADPRPWNYASVDNPQNSYGRQLASAIASHGTRAVGSRNPASFLKQNPRFLDQFTTAAGSSANSDGRSVDSVGISSTDSPVAENASVTAAKKKKKNKKKKKKGPNAASTSMETSKDDDVEDASENSEEDAASRDIGGPSNSADSKEGTALEGSATSDVPHVTSDATNASENAPVTGPKKKNKKKKKKGGNANAAPDSTTANAGSASTSSKDEGGEDAPENFNGKSGSSSKETIVGNSGSRGDESAGDRSAPKHGVEKSSGKSRK